MLTRSLERLKARMKSLIEADAMTVTVIRRRIDPAVLPESYDVRFGEATEENQIVFLEATYQCKWFWGVTEKALLIIFGGKTTAEATVHFALEAEVIENDFLEYNGKDYQVTKVVNYPTYLEVYVEKRTRPGAAE